MDRFGTLVVMKILLATSNPHKLEEIRAVFDIQRRQWLASRSPVLGSAPSAKLPIELICLIDLARQFPEPIEDQPTFEGNARLKARHYARLTPYLCLADDSGLQVDLLDGEPGVRSARYASVKGPRDLVDMANNVLLLRQLGDAPAAKRTARFVCVMALCGPVLGSRADPGEGAPILALVRGTVEGRILGPGDGGYSRKNPGGRGGGGFGYDPLFFVPELGRTTAELTKQQKNRISHRGQAARDMWKHIVRIAVQDQAE